jgi:hypothetical protein
VHRLDARRVLITSNVRPLEPDAVPHDLEECSDELEKRPEELDERLDKLGERADESR